MKKLRKFLKYAGLGLVALVVVVGLAVVYVLTWPEFGGSLEGARLERAQNSSQWHDGAFANDPPPPGFDMGVLFEE